MRVLKVGICGAGIVGGGVVEIIKRQRPLFQLQKFDFVVKTIASRDAKCHGFTPEAGTRVTDKLEDVINDPELDIVVEAMGGIEPAMTVFRSTKAHVVTANKALLAEQLPELSKLFRTRRKRLGFEASVAGGVPIIRALQHSLSTDTLTSVSGIMNGTTNLILSAMAEQGKGYEEVLKEAQEAGYAEADPTADVEGHDARNKLVLLTRLATGLYVPPAKVRTVGITSVTDWDFAAWRELGYTIKLLGSMQVFEPKTGGAEVDSPSPSTGKPLRHVDLFVSPAVVRKSSGFGLTSGAMNLVRVNGEATGVTSYYGAGAGRYATANSILADMVALAQGTVCVPPFPRPTPARMGWSMKVSGALERDWYVRGPKEAVELASIALWRMGHCVTPIGPAGGSIKGMTVEGASYAELAALVRRVTGKGKVAASGPGVVCFPLVKEAW